MNIVLLKLYMKFQAFAASEDGQDLVEYSLLLTIVALALISGMRGIATAVTGVFANASNSLV